MTESRSISALGSAIVLSMDYFVSGMRFLELRRVDRILGQHQKKKRRRPAWETIKAQH